MSAIGSLSGNYLQLIFNTLQSAGVTSGVAGNNSTSDSSQLSPLAQLLNTLQQLQQSDPAKYRQVTQQIATNLQGAAQSSQSAGNTAAADQLNQLATDFSNASKTGQLPNIQDLAQAVGGGHHHHHHHAASSSSASEDTSTSSSASSSNSATGTQTGTQKGSPNPLAIILNTLSNAGISTSNS
jgi:hypothetical protein